MNIGFIGLGQMGSGMAANLLKGGHTVTVFNRTAAKAERFRTEGAVVASSASEAAANQQAVFTMLADDNALADVLWQQNGLFETLASDTVHISSSTISAAFARKIAEEHARRSQLFVSAPVFGRPEAALSKKLLVVAAGPDNLLQQVKPALDALGRETFLVGSEPWHANAIKLCGNFMIASMLETFAEAFTALRKGGVDHHRFLQIMIELFGSPVYRNYGELMASGKFEPAGFALPLGFKDVRQITELAQDVQSPMPLASLIKDHLLSALAHGQQQMDWSSIEQVLARNAGLAVPPAVPPKGTA